jgi:hypothetical protein
MIKDSPLYLDFLKVESTPDEQETVKSLSAEQWSRLPELIRRELKQREHWCSVDRSQKDSVRYNRQCQFWIPENDQWKKVSFREFDSHRNGLAFAPVAQKGASGGASSQPTNSAFNQAALNSFFLSSSGISTNVAVPTVTLLSPDADEVIVLEASTKTRRRFTDYKAQPGDTVESIITRLNPALTANELYGLNTHISRNQSIQPGDWLRVPTGYNVIIEGSVSNATEVHLQWSGAASGSETIDIPPMAENERYYWDTHLELPPGDYQLTAKAGSAQDELKFSVQEVKQLQFGVFFDGTGNNKDVDMQCADDDFEPTNVAKLFELYPEEDVLGLGRHYVKGIGTENDLLQCGVGDEPDYSMLEQGLGLGINDRIHEALDRLKTFFGLFKSNKRIHCKIDIFGFSRGAATARAFINRLHELKKMPANGYWRKEQVTIEVRFCGLFDTVGSIIQPGGDYNGGFNLNLGRVSAKAVYHLTAYHEYREYFPISSLKTESGRLPAAHFAEECLPGAHSDIGGGYGGDNIERTIYLDRMVIHWRTSSDRKNKLQQVEQRLSHWQKEKAGLGGIFSIESQKRTLRRHRTQEVCYIVWKRRVKKELSFIALEKMYQKALTHGLPLKPMTELDAQNLHYKIDSSLRQLYQRALKNDATAMQALYREYIHHSHSPITPKGELINPAKPESNPKHAADNGIRQMYFNQPNKAIT